MGPPPARQFAMDGIEPGHDRLPAVVRLHERLTVSTQELRKLPILQEPHHGIGKGGRFIGHQEIPTRHGPDPFIAKGRGNGGGCCGKGIQQLDDDPAAGEDRCDKNRCLLVTAIEI